MARKAKKDENYLDYIPAVSTKNSWDADAEGNVTIHMVHRGFYAWIAQEGLSPPAREPYRPRRDGELYLPPDLTGERTVGQDCAVVRERFGADAECRCTSGWRSICRSCATNGFIYYAGKDRAPQ